VRLLRRTVCFFDYVVSNLDPRVRIQEPRRILFPVSLCLFLSQSPNSPLFCCFLFQFTSSPFVWHFLLIHKSNTSDEITMSFNYNRFLSKLQLVVQQEQDFKMRFAYMYLLFIRNSNRMIHREKSTFHGNVIFSETNGLRRSSNFLLANCRTWATTRRDLLANCRTWSTTRRDLLANCRTRSTTRRENRCCTNRRELQRMWVRTKWAHLSEIGCHKSNCRFKNVGVSGSTLGELKLRGNWITPESIPPEWIPSDSNNWKAVIDIWGSFGFFWQQKSVKTGRILPQRLVTLASNICDWK